MARGSTLCLDIPSLLRCISIHKYPIEELPHNRTWRGHHLPPGRNSILPDPEFHTHVTPFRYNLGDNMHRLGNPAFNLVAAFEVPKRFTPVSSKGRWINRLVKSRSSTLKNIVVKRSLPQIINRAERPVEPEIDILTIRRDTRLSHK